MAFAMSSAICEYMQSVDRLTHAVQLGRPLSHFVVMSGKTSSLNMDDMDYLCLAINTLPTTERGLITLLFWAPGATDIDLWRQRHVSRALRIKLRMTVGLLLRVEGRVNAAGIGTQHNRGNNA